MSTLDFLSMPKPRAPRTLVEIAAVNLLNSGAYGPKPGVFDQLKAGKRASEALVTVGCLAIAWHQGAAAGDRPTQAEYADYWKMTARQAQREWANFNVAFPSEDGPWRLAQLVLTNWSERVSESARNRSPHFALSLPAEGEFAPLAA